MRAGERVFRLVLQYDGTDFHGWQVQPRLRTIQGALIDALRRITRDDDATVQGASRTDRGVHALGQVARALAVTQIPAIKLRAALNGVLPEDVRVSEASEADEGFHPRFEARGKHYRYLIDNNRWANPLHRRLCWQVHHSLDLEAMDEAAQAFVGEQDFASFAPAREDRPTVREVMEARVQILGAGLLSFDVAGDGFLWNQVRTMAGTLVDVGRGAMPAAAMAEVLARRDRRAAGQTAPPQGLTLMKVYFDEAPHISGAPPLALGASAGASSPPRVGAADAPL